jgi:hypothetical protein
MADLPTINAIEELKASSKDDRQRLQKSLRAGLLNVTKSIDNLSALMAQSLGIQQAALDADARARQAAYEAQLEASRKAESATPADTAAGATSEDGGFGLLGIGAIIAGVGAALAAAATGFALELSKTLNSIFFKKSSPFIKSLDKGFKFLTEGLGKWFDDIAKAFQSMLRKARFKANKNFGNFLRPIERFFARFGQGKIGSILKNMTVKPLTDAFEMMKSLFSQFKGLLSVTDDAAKGAGIISRFLGSFRTVFSGIQPLIKIAGTIGRIAGKLFVPLTFFMGMWETVSGFLTGFQETQGDLVDKIIGGLQGGVDALINFLVAEPLNLLKSIVSWGLEKLGFDNASEALDSFDFMTDVFKPLTDRIFGVVKGVKDFLVGLFTWDVSLMGEGAETITSFILDVVGAPYNLLMKGIGWLLEKFGFEEIGSMMGEFDFATVVKDLLAMPYNALKGVGSKVAEFFGFGDDEEEKELKEAQEKALAERKKAQEERDKKMRDRVKESQKLFKTDQLTPEEAKKRGLIDFADQDDLNDYIEQNRMKDQVLRPTLSTGAEVDVRSREVASGTAPVVNVTAPSTTVTNNTQSSQNMTTVASASPWRQRPTPRYGAQLGYAGIRA